MSQIPHKHDYKLLKRWRWQGTDKYVVVQGCVECQDVNAAAVDLMWIPASQEELDAANQIADSLEFFARERSEK